MPERLAKDVMIPMAEYATVNVNDSLRHAIRVLKDSLPLGHRTLAVLDDSGNLVGFLTTRTILKALNDYAFEGDLWTAWSGSWTIFFLESKTEQLKKIKVRKVMRSVIDVFVNEDTPLHEVVRVNLKNRINHIPVLNKDLKVVGIIRTIDILDVLSDFLKG